MMQGRSVRTAWAVRCALAASLCLIPASTNVPAHSAATPCTYLEWEDKQQNPPRPIMNAVGGGFLSMSADTSRLVYRGARDGKVRWSRRLTGWSPWLARTGQQAVTVEHADCGVLHLTNWSLTSGHAQWTRSLPPLTGLATPHDADALATFDLGIGDWNRDGRPDLALLQIGRIYASGLDFCFSQPSGYCTSATQTTVGSRLVVVDGRNGTVLLNTSLGSGQRVPPAATWTADGSRLLAVSPETDQTVTVREFSASASSPRHASLVAPQLTDLQVYGTDPPVVATTAAYQGDTPEGGSLVGLSPTLSSLWTLPKLAGSVTHQVSRNRLVLVNASNGALVGVDTKAGLPVWGSVEPSGVDGYVLDAGHLSTPSVSDIGLALPIIEGTAVTSVVSGATGARSATLDNDEWPLTSCDTGAVLATITHPFQASVLVRARPHGGAPIWESTADLGPVSASFAQVCINARATVFVTFGYGRGQVAFDSRTGQTLWRTSDKP